MKKGDIVLHDGFKVEIRRGAPVRFGERRAIVKRLVDGQSYAVSLRHLTPLAVDRVYWLCPKGHENHDIGTRFCWACDAPRH